jgi:UrcA family protein
MTQPTTKFSDLWHGSMLAALTACMAVGLAGVARSATPDDAPPSTTVSYGDLDLATAQGANALHVRLTAAARQVCSANSMDMRDVQAYAAERSCETKAIAKAEQDVHAPKVAAR